MFSENFYEDVFFVPFIITVSTCVNISSVVTFQFDGCIDTKKKHSAINNFHGTRVYKPASPGSIACHNNIIVQPVPYFFCSSNKYF